MATYTYDGILRRSTATINTDTPINHQYVYRSSERGGNAQTTKIGWEHFNDYIYGYTYDANGNITLITRRDKRIENSTYENQQQFAYDELNQLIRADDLAKNCTEVYTYDNGGNILSVTKYPLTWGSLDGVAATNTTNYTYGDSNWKDKLTSYNGQAITYDEIGNPLNYRGYTLTWQNGRQLASLSGNGTTASYTYDADGNPSGVRYDWDGLVLNYYFVCNWRGDVVQIYKENGALHASYEYDAWGNVLSVRSANGAIISSTYNIATINPLRYRGYYYDSETGMYYLKSRYYDPATRRFLNSDGYVSTGQSILGNNIFSYCDNNPVNREDSNGHFWKELKAKVKSAWNGLKTWINNTFGSSTSLKKQSKTAITQKNYGIFTYEYGIKSTVSVSNENSSKRISTYINFNSSDVEGQSLDVGIKLSFSDTCNLKIGTNFSNISISANYGDNNSTLCADFENLKIGYTQSAKIRWDNGASVESYTSINVDITTIFMVYCSKSLVPSLDGSPYWNSIPAY